LDVVFVRQRARQIASLIRFDALDQTRISTSVSEIARNAFLYANGGRAQFFIEGGAPERLVIRISDRGPGIQQLAVILSGQYRSTTGMGLGILGAQKLMDGFRAETVPGHGTTIEMSKLLPASHPRATPELVAHLSSELAKVMPSGPLEEIRQQNIELLRALDDVKARQIEMDRMYRELTEAHRQVLDFNLQLENKTVALETSSRSERLARADAEAAVELREDMLAVVSHDLRTPLASIVASASVLNRTASQGSSAAEQGNRKATDIILRSAHRMSGLIADLLDLAMIRTGKIAIDRQPVSVTDLVTEITDTLQPVATQHGLTLSGTVSSRLWVSCDKERVLQILSNLVSNAIKFTPAGGTVAIAVTSTDSEVAFEISDTGRGVSAEDLPHIFERFWQVQKRNSGGIGLGLSIVAGLVEAHGGKVWAVSELGVGSRFFFTLIPSLAPAARLHSQPHT
jgi:signal transduction histidine kinase